MESDKYLSSSRPKIARLTLNKLVYLGGMVYVDVHFRGKLRIKALPCSKRKWSQELEVAVL